jgi:hypothetical protein
MRGLAAAVLIIGALAGCSQTTTTTSAPSASPSPPYTQTTCVAAGGVWNPSTMVCVFASPTAPASGSQTGPSGTPGERRPGY